jgi:hypothetical protein
MISGRQGDKWMANYSGTKGYVDGQWSSRAGRAVINPADETLHRVKKISHLTA